MKFSLCLSLLLAGLQVQCHHVPGHRDEQDENGNENPHDPLAGQGFEASSYKKIASSNTEFLFRLYRHITSDPAPQNIFFSPLSISTVVAMMALGAKNETHHQIFHGLSFNLSDIPENEIHGGFSLIIRTLNQPNNVAQINLGNALFIEQSLKLLPQFLRDVKTLYEAEGFSTSFEDSTAAENEINSYVKNKTNGKISCAVTGLDPRTVMVLLNYVYFKASWEKPFNSQSTREADFFVDANTTVKVNMMFRKGDYDYYRDNDLTCWVVRVPYKGDFSAWFILPDQGKLKEVEDALSVDVLNKWRASFRHHEIQLSIPKFSISGSYDVKALLQRVGVNDLFNYNADLSGITGERNLKVSRGNSDSEEYERADFNCYSPFYLQLWPPHFATYVDQACVTRCILSNDHCQNPTVYRIITCFTAVHRAVLDVHERGTEAAAITVLEVHPLIAPLFSVIIELNKPFLMFIANNPTRHFVFMAKVINPTAK